jgi:predicted CXXCH cytochrome family protein
MRTPIPIFVGAMILALCSPLTVMAGTLPSYANGSPNITNSPHNLNNVGITLPEGQICIVCHTPHQAAQYPSTTSPNSLLWNHTTNANQVYSLYIGTNTALDTTSRLCLGCHDGAIAIDSFGGPEGGNGTGTLISSITDSYGTVGGGQITVSGTTTNLTNTHPLGVAYPGVSGKTGSSYSSGGYTFTGGTWTSTSFNNPNNFTGGVGLVQLNGSTTSYGVGCTSCHTPHDYTNKFLVESNSGSTICLTCHIK